MKKAEENARERWEYVKGQLLELGQSKPHPEGREFDYLSAEEAAALAFPPLESFKPYEPDLRVKAPVGLVINHVLSELTYNNPRSPFNGWKWKALKEGGYQIHTTIDKRAQEAAEAAADQARDTSPMFEQPANLEAAAGRGRAGHRPGARLLRWARRHRRRLRRHLLRRER